MNYKGNRAGCSALHLRVRSKRTGCCSVQGCTFTGRTHMAHRTHDYLDDAGWMEMCPKHHYEYDVANGLRDGMRAVRRAAPIATHCKYGHEFTSENTHIAKAGARQCRSCAARRQRERRALARATS